MPAAPVSAIWLTGPRVSKLDEVSTSLDCRTNAPSKVSLTVSETPPGTRWAGLNTSVFPFADQRGLPCLLNAAQLMPVRNSSLSSTSMIFASIIT